MADVSDLIPIAAVATQTDKIGKIWELVGSSVGTSTDPVGTSCISEYASQFLNLTVGCIGTNYGLGNKAQLDALSSPAKGIADIFKTGEMMRSQFGTYILAVENHIAQYGRYLSTTVKSLDTLAAYHNSATAFSLLYSYQFASVYYLYSGTTLMLAATNVLGPSIMFGSLTATDANATYYDGAAIGTVNVVASGTQGYSPDQVDMVVVSGTFSGTVVATGINQAGVGTHYWTATVANMTSAHAATTLTPGTVGERTTNLTSVSLANPVGTACFKLISRGRAVG
jgi:hypothetical protein